MAAGIAAVEGARAAEVAASEVLAGVVAELVVRELVAFLGLGVTSGSTWRMACISICCCICCCISACCCRYACCSSTLILCSAAAASDSGLGAATATTGWSSYGMNSRAFFANSSFVCRASTRCISQKRAHDGLQEIMFIPFCTRRSCELGRLQVSRRQFGLW